MHGSDRAALAGENVSVSTDPGSFLIYSVAVDVNGAGQRIQVGHAITPMWCNLTENPNNCTTIPDFTTFGACAGTPGALCYAGAAGTVLVDNNATTAAELNPTVGAGTFIAGVEIETNAAGKAQVLQVDNGEWTGHQIGIDTVEAYRGRTYAIRFDIQNKNGVLTYDAPATIAFRTLPPSGVSLDEVHESSATLSWNAIQPRGPDNGFLVDASTASDFTGSLDLSSATPNGDLLTLSVLSMSVNTTYYIRVGAVYGGTTDYAASVTTVTLAPAASSPGFSGVFQSSASVSWTDAETWEYRVENSTAADFSGVVRSSTSSNGDITELFVHSPALAADTTYYYRVGSLNRGGTARYTAVLATSTLTGLIAAPQIDAVYATSATVSYGQVTGQGYRLEASPNADFTTTILSSVTPNGSLLSLTVSGLSPDTTYYLRVGGQNHNGVPHTVPAGSTATLTSPPTPVSFAGVFLSSVTVSWTDTAAQGYRLDASVNGDFSEPLISSITADGDLNPPQLYAESLAPNTTYYFRVSGVNHNGAVDFVTMGSTATLADPPGSPEVSEVHFTSITLAWSDVDARGYRVDAGLTSSFASFTSSFTPNGDSTRLSVIGLSANTTYYLRVGAQNHDGVFSFSPVAGVSVSSANPPGVAAFGAVGLSSAPADWTDGSNPAGTRYEAQISTDAFATLNLSTETGNTAALFGTGGAGPALQQDTTHYFRVRAVNRAGYPSDFAILGSTWTTAAQPAPLDPGSITENQIQADWDPNGNPSDTQFHADISTAVDYTGEDDLTAVETTDAHLFSGLNPNTTYYSRVRAFSRGGLFSDFATLATTATLPVAPGAASPGFTGVAADAAVFIWTESGFPQNPAGTEYEAQLSTDDFATVNLGSRTHNQSVLFGTGGAGPALGLNTTYYFRARGLNHRGIPGAWAATASTATLAASPISDLFGAVGPSSATPRWTAAGNPEGTLYEARVSTDGFATFNLSSATLDAAALFGSGGEGPDLSPNTTYYARVRALNRNGTATTFTTLGSTATLALVPGAAGSPFSGLTNSSVTASWADAGNPAGTLYQAEVSTDNFSTLNLSSRTRSTSALFGAGGLGDDLASNTTHHFRVRAVNHEQRATTELSIGELATLGDPVSGFQFQGVFESSVSVNWVELAPGQAEGYALDASTAPDFSGSVISSQTPSVGLSTLTVSDLGAGATYYFRVGSLNRAGTPNYDFAGSTRTVLPPGAPPSNPLVAAVFRTSVTISWIPVGSSDGYSVDASTAPDFTGSLDQSSATPNGENTNLTVESLDSNTTYYFRVAALHPVPSYSPTEPSTSTLSNKVAGLAFKLIHRTSATLTWNELSGALKDISEGYRLDASPNAAFTGTVYSSITPNVALSTLTVEGLALNTTYYFRVGALNHNGVPHHEILGSSATLAAVPGAAPFAGVRRSSITALWTANGNPGWTEYAASVSTDNFASINVSSRTKNLSVVFGSGGFGPALDANTTHYFRVRAVNLNDASKDLVVLGSTHTLAAAVSGSGFAALHNTSATVSWTALPASPVKDSAEGYRVDASTAPDFSGTVRFSSTADHSLGQLTVSGIDANTTYYFRVGSYNQNAVPNYAGLVSSATLANKVAGAEVKGIHETSATFTWNAMTGALKDISEGYRLDASPNADFSVTVFSSITPSVALSTLTVANLTRNSTYYFRVGSLNHREIAHFVFFPSTWTRAALPGVPGPALTGIGLSSMTANWTLNGNPAGTEFSAEISTDNFGTVNFSSFTFGQSVRFGSGGAGSPLGLNTTYYFRVRTEGRVGVKNPFVALGSSSTLAAQPGAAALSTIGVSSVTANWTQNGNPGGTTFIAQMSTDNFSTVNFSSRTPAALALFGTGGAGGALGPNATYYFRVRSESRGGAPTSPVVLGSTVTYAAAPGASAFTAVGVSSVTANWTASGNPSGTPYQAQISTDNFASVNFSSQTAGVSALFGTGGAGAALTLNSTYYFRVRAVSRLGIATPYAALGSTVTTPATPGASGAPLTTVGLSSITANWTAGGNPAGSVFLAQVSTDNFATVNLSSETKNESALFGTGGAGPALDANTTHYFRVRTQGHGSSQSAFLSIGSTATLADLPSPAAPATVGVSSITANWTAGVNPSGTLYKAQISTDNFSTVNRTSGTMNAFALFGSGDALDSNTTYYFRVQAVNRRGLGTDFAALASTPTLAALPGATGLSAVSLSSITASWSANGNPAGTEYAAQVSTDNFSTLNFSSTTMNAAVLFGSGGAGLALDANTTHYFRVRAVNRGGLASSFSVLGGTSTLAVAVTPVSPVENSYLAAYASSVTVTWTALPASPPQGASAEGYRVDASTAPDFSGTVRSSATTTLGANTLTVTGLQIDTTHFFRVGSLNWNSEPNFVLIGGTKTQVSTLTWTGAGADQSWYTTGNWSPNGTPSDKTAVLIDITDTVTTLATDPPIDFFSLTIGRTDRTTLPQLVLSTGIGSGGSVVMKASGTISQDLALPIAVSGDWTMESGSLLTHTANTGLPLAKAVRLSVGGTFDLQAGATVTATGLGYAGGASGASGQGSGAGGGSGTAGGGGAGYGGAGGAGSGGAGGSVYNSQTNPTEAGSGGGGGKDAGGTGGAGGGLVRITAQTAKLNGSIFAQGAVSPTTNRAGGGGSGGGVNIQAASVSGTGIFRANGGTAAGTLAAGGGGGGGRLAITATGSCSLAPSTYTVFAGLQGGAGDGANGSPGTAYFGDATMSGFAGVAVTSESVGWSWTLTPGASAYQVIGGAPVSPILVSSVSAWSETGLTPNTQYTRFVRGWVCLASGDSASSPVYTLTKEPTGAAFKGVHESSISAHFVDFPALGDSANGYRLQASKFADFSAPTSSDTAEVNLSTLAVPALEANTTYYMRVGAVNADGFHHYAALPATATLAQKISGMQIAAIHQTSVTLNWVPRLVVPQADSSQGYLLQASTAADFTGAWSSSRTAFVGVSTLTVTGLIPNTTYTFRVGSLNWGGAANFLIGPSTPTLAASPAPGPFSSVGLSSVAASWTANGNPEGTRYAAQASTDNFSTLNFSSDTLNLFALFGTGGAGDPLPANTTHYFRVRARNHNADSVFTSQTVLGSTATFADEPVAAAFTAVERSSVTASWTGASNPSGTVFEARISTDNFSTYNRSSETLATSVHWGAGGAAPGLSENTTYYFSVRALNHNRVPTLFTILGSTSTLADPPGIADYLDIGLSSAVPSWTAGNNPSETFYRAQISTDNFATVNLSSITRDLSAIFGTNGAGDPLPFNTTHYFRVSALNNNGVATIDTVLGSTPTRSGPPAFDSYPAVEISSISAQWTAAGNPAGTLYAAEISTDNFATVNAASNTLNQSVLFGAGGVHDDLEVNATYYFRTRSVGHSALASDYTVFPATASLAAEPDAAAAPFADIGTSSGVVAWAESSPPQNPAGTQYAAQVSTDGFATVNFTSRTFNKTAFFGTGGEGAALDPNTTHFFRVRAHNRNDAATSWRVIGSSLTSAADPGAAAFTGVGVSSASANWTDGGNPAGTVFEAEVSTDAFATVNRASSTLGTWAAFGTGGAGEPLSANTTYYFRVRAANGAGTRTGWTTLGSTATLALVPAAAGSPFQGATNSSVTVSWADGGNPSGTGYETDSSTDNFSSVNLTTRTKNLSALFGAGGFGPDLAPNTTHYFRARAVNHQGRATTEAALGEVSTLADPVSGFQFQEVSESSVAVSWVELGAGESEGYRLDASTAADFSGNILSSATPSVALSTLTVAELAAGATYYFRVGSLNWIDAPNYEPAGSTLTFLPPSSPPSNPQVSAFFESSVTVSWIPVSSDDGYVVEASTASDFSGALDTSSATPNGEGASLTVLGLVTNTTYYLRVGALYLPSTSYSPAEPSTATLAGTVSDLDYLLVHETSATIEWTALGGAQEDSSEGYILDVAADPGFASIVTTTRTPNPALSTLTASGLAINTTHFFRVGSLNPGQRPNFLILGSTATRTTLPGSAPFTFVRESSVTASWTANSNPAGTEYAVDLSTDDFATLNLSSRTRNLSVVFGTGGFGTDLAANTTHHFRVRSVNLNDASSELRLLGSTHTLAVPVANTAVAAMHNTSGTVSWDALAASPVSASAEGYRVQASTAPDFTGAVKFSSTTDYGLGTLTVEGLDANSTYYFRVGSLNQDGVPHWAGWVSSPTLANQVSGAEFTLIHETSATVTWNELSGALKDISEGYRLDASTNADFSAPVQSSITPSVALSTLTAVGLSRNATYYFRVGSYGHNGVSHFVFLPSSVTRTAVPSAAAFSGVRKSSITSAWTDGTNPSDTEYFVELSTDDFSTLNLSSTTRNLSVKWGAGGEGPSLDRNTTHYFRVAALNRGGTPSEFALLGGTATLAGEVNGIQAAAVFKTSVTVNWVELPGAPPFDPSSEGYLLQLSTAPDFTGTIKSSSTPEVGLSTLTAFNLNANTTYYMRVGALNHNGVPSFSVGGSTKTEVSPFVWTGAGGDNRWFTATNWNPNGTPDADSKVTIDANASVVALPADPPVSFESLTLGAAGGANEANLTLSTGVGQGGGVTIHENAGLTLGSTQLFRIDGDLTMLQGSTLTHAANGAQLSAVIWVSLSGAFDLQAGATITAAALGYAGGAAGTGDTPGAGPGGGASGPAATNHAGGGGGYGGAGGQSTEGNAGGSANGSSSTPDDAGSGGGGAKDSAGGAGGGLVRIEADSMILDGFISAGGADSGAGGRTGGGGSGGAIRIEAQAISGAGSFRADGGDAGAASIVAGGGGGGGRASMIAANSCSLAPSTFSVDAGLSGGIDPAANGSPGSVYDGASSPANFAGVVQSSTAILWSWEAAAGAGSYQLRASSGGPMSPALSNATLSFLASDLLPNTTYANFVRGLFCFAGGDSASDEIATLPKRVFGTSFIGVFNSSATIGWAAFPAAPQEDRATAYVLEASTAPDFTGSLDTSSRTVEMAFSTLTVTGLDANTTYYFRVGAEGFAGTYNYATLGSTSTLADAVSGEQLDAVFETSATFSWTTLPANPLKETSEGYRIEASTSADYTGSADRSSTTVEVGLGSLAVLNLDRNTTYYFRVGSLDHDGDGNYKTIPATATLAAEISQVAEPFAGVFQTSVSVNWVALPAPPPDSASSEGYMVQASSTNFGELFPGGGILSSATPSVALSTLTVPGLEPGTTYYFRAGALNWNRVPNFVALGSTLPVANELGVVISTHDLTIGLVDLNSELVISTSFLVTSVGNINQTYELAATTITAGSPWTISSSSGTDAFTLQAGFNSTEPSASNFVELDKLSDSFTPCDGSSFVMDQDCQSVGAGENRLLWLKLGMPKVSSTEAEQEIRITINAVQ